MSKQNKKQSKVEKIHKEVNLMLDKTILFGRKQVLNDLQNSVNDSIKEGYGGFKMSAIARFLEDWKEANNKLEEQIEEQEDK